MLGRDMVKEIEEKGLQHYFDPIKHLMENRYVVANLECVLADDLKPREDIKNPLIAPTWMAEQLKAVGVDAVSLANNHIMDCGEEGKESTKDSLTINGINYFGDKNILVKINNRLVSFTSSCAPFNIQQFVSPISDYRIFMPHSGIELFQYPLPKDEQLYKQLVKYSRVDLIAGSHSHCIQTGERYLDSFIFYGLGDFISDCHKNWELFWEDEAHPKKFGFVKKEYAQYRLFDSLIIDINFESFKPEVNIYTYNSLQNKIITNCRFENLVFNYSFDNEVLKERYRIEEELCKTIK